MGRSGSFSVSPAKRKGMGQYILRLTRQCTWSITLLGNPTLVQVVYFGLEVEESLILYARRSREKTEDLLTCSDCHEK